MTVYDHSGNALGSATRRMPARLDLRGAARNSIGTPGAGASAFFGRSPLRLILFDCDGTLVDSEALIVSAMRAAFSSHGVRAPSAEEVRAIIGLSLPTAVATLCAAHPEAPVEAVAQAYRLAYRDLAGDAAASESLFEGVAEMLDAVDREDVLLGIATDKSRVGLARILAAHRLEGRFVVTKTADDAPSKPAPDMVLDAMAAVGVGPDATIVVGDTTFDIEMARAAGAAAIGVVWGSHPPEALLGAGALRVAYNVGELPSLIEGAFVDA